MPFFCCCVGGATGGFPVGLWSGACVCILCCCCGCGCAPRGAAAGVRRAFAFVFSSPSARLGVGAAVAVAFKAAFPPAAPPGVGAATAFSKSCIIGASERDAGKEGRRSREKNVLERKTRAQGKK